MSRTNFLKTVFVLVGFFQVIHLMGFSPGFVDLGNDSWAKSRGNLKKSSHIGVVELSKLPPEAITTLRLILKGGPFPYKRDGVTFQNREKLLPLKRRGYYKEYTVKTPGRRDRGARRIVAGSKGEFYYTSDHYRSFKRIVKNHDKTSKNNK